MFFCGYMVLANRLWTPRVCEYGDCCSCWLSFLVFNCIKWICGFPFHRRGIHRSTFHCHTHPVEDTHFYADCDSHSDGDLYSQPYADADLHADYDVYAHGDLYQYPIAHTDAAAAANYRSCSL